MKSTTLKISWFVVLGIMAGIGGIWYFVTNPPKVAMPASGVWVYRSTVGSELTATYCVTAGKQWRVEHHGFPPESQWVVVHDGNGTVGSVPFAVAWVEKEKPLRKIEQIYAVFNAHPRPELERLDGEWCWYAMQATETTRTEVWVKFGTNLLRKASIEDAQSGIRSEVFGQASDEALRNESVFNLNSMTPLYERGVP